MKTLSLKLQDQIFIETEDILAMLKLPRNAYINDAIAYYNKIKQREALAKQLRYEAGILQEDTLETIAEMHDLDPHLLDM